MGYDALGRRVFKKYRAKETRWIWDRDVVLHEWVKNDSMPAKREEITGSLGEALTIASRLREGVQTEQAAQGPPFVWERPSGSESAPLTWVFEPESFAPAALLADGQSYAIVTDHLGTPLRLMDSSGRELWGASLGAYGDVRGTRGGEPKRDSRYARAAVPFRWQGQYDDPETGLYYNRFRHYDPDAGQYISRDPIGLEGGLRGYGYVGDPTFWVDPLGLTGCAAANLPQMKGSSVAESEQTLTEHGFTRTHVSNSVARNQTWRHPDGSEVRIHPYGNQATGVYRSGNNAHIHKESPSGAQLTDRGIPSNDPAQTHIGIKNPSDLPAVRGRPHGAGTQ
jgi:RHS repeat-associated protein